jgi:hypothetical protein
VSSASTCRARSSARSRAPFDVGIAAEQRELPGDVREQGARELELRVRAQRRRQQRGRLLHLGRAAGVVFRQRTEIEVVGGEVRGRLAARARDLGLHDRRLQHRRDRRHHAVVQGEQVLGCALEPVRPELRLARRLDQLRGDAHAPARQAHAALDHVAHAERAPDLAQIDQRGLERGRRVARDHQKRAEARECRGEFLGDAVGEVVLLRPAADLLERQDDDRGPVQRQCGRPGGRR